MPEATPRHATPRLGGSLRDLADETSDVLIIGGGITGAGVARHAAQAGLRTALVEADDFAAGTSSRSTKLIHGGLRYLAMGDFALVRESARERKSVRRMAPHLTEPRWMLVPAASWWRHVELRVGIGLYERLGAVAREERHRNWGPDELDAGEPLLARDRYRRACVYREYVTDDARLVLATLRAAARGGARLLNYVRARAVEHSDGACRVLVADTATGEQRELRARAVVNAAGPWAESLLAPTPTPRLHLSKGVHVVFRHARLPLAHPVMVTAADGRPVFVIPRGAVTYAGTTDTTYGAPPQHWPGVTPEDVQYLLDAVNRNFRVAPLAAADVVATWSGLRPLIAQAGKAPKEMSRRDEIWRHGAVVSVAGGKLTGFRRMAEQTMTAVAEVLQRELSVTDPLEPLPGGDLEDPAALVASVAGRYGLEQTVAERLVRAYGSEVPAVLGETPRRLSASVFDEEVVWAVEVEAARRLDDLIYRRLGAAWYLPDERDALVSVAAARMAELLSWPPATLEAELARTRRRLAAERAPFTPP
ncbi:MAG: glycerol-3-phosphate dehydrogenase/oxidase [Pseudomonadota bacterium]